MSLDCAVTARHDLFVLDAALFVGDGEVLALLGPNGSGKSTLLRAVAGLLTVDSGTVRVNGRVVTRSGDGAEVSVPANRRGVGLLGQDPLLFPHLTVLQNVAFGGLAQGRDFGSTMRRAIEWLDAVGLVGFEHRRPSALSGGQQQRAAIARALAAEPDVLLLDEPMAALDVQSAAMIRALLRERLTDLGITTVLVTHDVVDAIVLADRIAILDDGRIVDDGDTSRVLGQPVNRFAASLAGLNLLRGTVTGDHQLRVADGRTLTGRGELPPAGSHVRVVFPHSAVTVRPRTRSVTGINSWAGSIAAIEPAAGGIRIALTGDTILAELAPTEVVASGLKVGSEVTLHVSPASIAVYVDSGTATEVG